MLKSIDIHQIIETMNILNGQIFNNVSPNIELIYRKTLSDLKAELKAHGLKAELVHLCPDCYDKIEKFQEYWTNYTGSCSNCSANEGFGLFYIAISNLETYA